MLLSKKAIPFFIYPVLGLCVGWGWAAISVDRRQVESGEKVPKGQGTASHHRAADLLRVARKDRWIREQRGDSIQSLVSRWSDDELVAALNEEPLGEDVLLRFDSVCVKLLAELSRRDPERALAWVQEQPAIFYPKFAESLISGWLPHSIDHAFAVVVNQPEIFKGIPPANLVKISLEQAVSLGPEKFVARMRELHEVGATSSSLGPSYPYPEGFDFAAVLGSEIFSSLKLHEAEENLVIAWAKNDREAAFQWLIEKNDIRKISMLMGDAITVPYAEKEAFSRWLLGKVEQLPSSQKAEFIELNASDLKNAQYDAIQWIDAASTSQMKDLIRMESAKAIFKGGRLQVEAGLDVIATLPDLESRLCLLEILAPDSDPFSVHFLNEEGERALRLRLKEWGSEEGWIDRILK